MIISGKKIGIWGYGVVGKSALAFLQPQNCTLSVYDQNELASDARAALTAESVSYYAPHKLANFLENQDIILPSPGIDLRPYTQYQHKFISELDLFKTAWHKPIIGITGTIGKTSITSLLSQILPAAGIPLATGGNIGTGMFDLVKEQAKASYALLELSSFQLELLQQSAPDIAIITNIYPNHIDRHGSMEAYVAAKLRMVTLQNSTQRALLPLSLAPIVRESTVNTAHPERSRRICFFTESEPTASELALLQPQDTIYYHHASKLYKFINKKFTNKQHLACNAIALPALSYPTNLLIIQAVLDMLGVTPATMTTSLTNLHIPEHRLACIAEHNGIRFYNDSKATIPEAMLAAVKKLQASPTILFLGGVSKGVDRTPAIAQLKNLNIKQVVCFGKEAAALHAACVTNHIPATTYSTLEEGFAAAMQNIAQPGDNILFSPAGASFDLFSNYQERGNSFKQLVEEYITRSHTKS